MDGFYKLKVDNRNTDGTIDFKTTGYNDFSSDGEFTIDIVDKIARFAYGMSFGNAGQHRDHRSGGKHHRNNGEIFINAFQGKLAEYAYYLEMKDYHDLEEPDLEMYNLGTWDNYDFKVESQIISIKSTKHFGKLLLLELDDWAEDGTYIPNNLRYDFICMIRIESELENEFKKHRLLYSNECEFEVILDIIHSMRFSYDIPRLISNDELVKLIAERYIIHQDDTLNGTKMDADNIYCYISDMHKLISFNY